MSHPDHPDRAKFTAKPAAKPPAKPIVKPTAKAKAKLLPHPAVRRPVRYGSGASHRRSVHPGRCGPAG